MATEAQVTANRLNARKSTGPRTEEGKAISAQNALKHGLLAREGIIRGEDQDEYDLHREQLLGQLLPGSPLEDILADRIVDLTWRLKRAAQDQDEAFGMLYDRLTADTPQAEEPAEQGALLGRMLLEDYGGAAVLERLLRCERRIEGSLYRTLNQLRRVHDQLVKAQEAEGETLARWREEDWEAKKARMFARSRPPEPPAGLAGIAPKAAAGVSGEQSPSPSVPKETVCDAHPADFTLGAAAGKTCETNPISPVARQEEVGRGRPTCPEAGGADEWRRTNPISGGVSSAKSEVSGEEGRESGPREPGLHP